MSTEITQSHGSALPSLNILIGTNQKTDSFDAIPSKSSVEEIF